MYDDFSYGTLRKLDLGPLQAALATSVPFKASEPNGPNSLLEKATSSGIL
jgi:hypothetical protein